MLHAMLEHAATESRMPLPGYNHILAPTSALPGGRRSAWVRYPRILGGSDMSELGQGVGDHVWYRVRSRVEFHVRRRVSRPVRERVWIYMWSRVWARVEGRVGARVWAHVQRSVGEHVWEREWRYMLNIMKRMEQ